MSGSTVFLNPSESGYPPLYEYDVDTNQTTAPDGRRRSLPALYAPFSTGSCLSATDASNASAACGKIGDDTVVYLKDGGGGTVDSLELIIQNIKSGTKQEMRDLFSLHELTPFDNDADAREFQAAAEKFTWAYLSADLTTMKAMLTDPQNSQHDFLLRDRSNETARLALKVYSDQITADFIPAEVEIVPKTGDSHDFLYLKIEKANTEWKVISYAMEK